MKQNSKNYWPLAIVGLICFGVVMISISIYISLSHPVQIDTMYGKDKRYIDDNINEILQAQNQFQNDNIMRFYTGEIAPSIYKNNADSTLSQPYSIKPHRDKATISPNMKTKDNIILAIEKSKDSNIDTLNIEVSALSYQKANITDKLGSMKLVKSDKKYSTFMLENVELEAGRYKIVFDVLDDSKLNASFIQEVFVQ